METHKSKLILPWTISSLFNASFDLTFSFLLKNLPKEDLNPFFFAAALCNESWDEFTELIGEVAFNKPLLTVGRNGDVLLVKRGKKYQNVSLTMLLK